MLLFYLQFCVWLFPLFIRSLRKLDGNRVQLVVLVAVGTAPPWGVRLVQVIVLVIWFSRVYTGVAISVIVGVHLSQSVQFIVLVAMAIAAIVVL